MAILDQYGRPIKVSQTDLKEAQTSRLASLHQEFAGHPVSGLTPQRLRRILEQAEQGDIVEQHNLFIDMMEKDAHIFAEMSKRCRVLLGLGYTIEPPPGADKKEQANAEFLQELITDIPDFEDIILDAADAIGHGFSCLEMEWGRHQNIWLPGDITHRPQSWFTLDRETRTELRLRGMSIDGEPLQPFTWITHTHRAKPGYVTRAGLHRVLSWPFIFKAFSVRDLAEFLEIYGLPLRLGKYPPGADDTEKATLMRAVAGIGHAAAGIIPQGMEIDFQEAAKGQGDPFMAMISWAEASQSKAILGGTLTSTAANTGLGSSQSDVQNEVRKDLRDSDARQIESTLTRDLLYPILALNGRIDNPRRCPRLKFDTDDPEDLDAKSKRDKVIFDMGFEPDEQYINDTYGGSWKKRATNDPQATAEGAPATAAAKAAFSLTEGDDGLDQLTADLTSGELNAQAEAMLGPLLALAESAPDQLLGRLADLYPEMATDQLEQRLAQIIFIAEIKGRIDAAEN